MKAKGGRCARLAFDDETSDAAGTKSKTARTIE